MLTSFIIIIKENIQICYLIGSVASNDFINKNTIILGFMNLKW